MAHDCLGGTGAYFMAHDSLAPPARRPSVVPPSPLSSKALPTGELRNVLDLKAPPLGF